MPPIRPAWDRYAAGCPASETVAPRVAVPGARSAPRDTVNQPKGSARVSLCGALWLVVAVALLSPAPHASAQSAVEKELIQLERDWDAAFFRNDIAFIDRVLAPEFVATYPDGARGDRNKELANAAAFNQQIESSTLNEFKVQVHGDTAIVWFTRRLVGPSKGRRLLIVHRYIDVFVRREGRWLCVATQSVRVPDLEQVGPEAPK